MTEVTHFDELSALIDERETLLSKVLAAVLTSLKEFVAFMALLGCF